MSQQFAWEMAGITIAIIGGLIGIVWKLLQKQVEGMRREFKESIASLDKKYEGMDGRLSDTVTYVRHEVRQLNASLHDVFFHIPKKE